MSTTIAATDRFLAAIYELRTIAPSALVAPTTDRERASRRTIRLIAACVPSSDDQNLAGLLGFLGHPALEADHLLAILRDPAPAGVPAEPPMSWLRELASGIGTEGRVALRSADPDARRVMVAFVNMLACADHAPGDWGHVAADTSGPDPAGAHSVLAGEELGEVVVGRG